MLKQAKFNRKKLLPYLAVMVILAGLIIFFLLQNSGGAGTADETDQSVAEIIPEIASLLKPQFDLNKLKNFDIEFFKDPRLFSFTAPPANPDGKPSKGRNNPFLPNPVASSTTASSSAGD